MAIAMIAELAYFLRFTAASNTGMRVDCTGGSGVVSA